MAIPRVDFPEPDSPTSPKERPGGSSKLAPSNARTTPRGVS